MIDKADVAIALWLFHFVLMIGRWSYLDCFGKVPRIEIVIRREEEVMEKDSYFYDLGKYVGSTGAKKPPPPETDLRTGAKLTTDQVRAWEEGWHAGAMEYRRGHGDE